MPNFKGKKYVHTDKISITGRLYCLRVKFLITEDGLHQGASPSIQELLIPSNDKVSLTWTLISVPELERSITTTWVCLLAKLIFTSSSEFTSSRLMPSTLRATLTPPSHKIEQQNDTGKGFIAIKNLRFSEMHTEVLTLTLPVPAH